MTQSAKKLESYLTGFETMRRKRADAGPEWLTDLSNQAWCCFTELGFPTARRGNEKWKYTNVAPIANTAFGFAPNLSPELGRDAVLPPGAPWEDGWTSAVFVDGKFSRSLSNAPAGNGKASVSSLAQAVNSGSHAVEKHLSKHAGFEDDGFSALNTAFLDDGAFIEVPEGCAPGLPIHLIFVTTDREQPRVSYPRTLLVAGRNSEVSVVETYLGPATARYFTNAVTEIVVDDGAVVDHYRLLMESPEAFHVGTSRARLGRDSILNSASLSLGAALARNDFLVNMEEPGGSCVLIGLYLTLDGQHIDNLVSIDHAKPHTSSRLSYKGILDGKSKAVFGGQVLVRKDAQKVVAHQSDDNLLLSDQAEVDSKPSLLIYADDVNCGHGATAGHLDAAAMFYLTSRGLGPDTARRMLIHAFAREIIETVKLEPLREYVDGLFLNAMPAANPNQRGGL